MNNSIKIFNDTGGPIAVNLDQIRCVRTYTNKTSTIIWADGTATNFEIPFNDLMEILYGIHAEEAEETKPSDIKLEDLKLTFGSFSVLKKAGMSTVADIISHTYEEIRDLHMCGRNRAREIKEAIEAIGYTLKEESI